VLVGLLVLLLMHVIGLRKTSSAVTAIAIGAVLFSLYHLSGEQLAGQAPLPWGDLVFRTLAGVYLGGVYVCRGFGISVGTHAAWNLLVAFINS